MAFPTVKHDLPKYRVAEALRPHLIKYLVTGGFAVGDQFLSDRQLMEATGKSRTAVRRALVQLQKEGWIERHGGVGTFVGPRLAMAQSDSGDFSVDKPHGNLIDSEVTNQAIKSEASSSQSMIRLAAVVAGLGHLQYGWWTSPWLHGIDAASEENGVALELLGDHLAKPAALTRRLEQHRPDVLTCLGPPINHATVIGEAKRQRIPCVLAGVRTPELQMPNIYEDIVAAFTEAVRHLYDRGHRSIAFVQVRNSGWWVFDRLEGYEKGLADCGLEPGGRLIHWVPTEADEQSAQTLSQFLQREQPTAVLFGCCWAAANMRWLTGHGGLSVPDDLSVIVSDQHGELDNWLGGVRATTVKLPLFETGKALASMARRLAEGRDVPDATMLPCTLVEGDSVRTLNKKVEK